MTDVDLLQALRDCYDPLLKRNIVDLKMVRSVYVTPDTNAPGAGIAGVPQKFLAKVTLESASSDEAARAQLVAQVSNRLAGIPEISHADVSLLPPAFPILNARLK